MGADTSRRDIALQDLTPSFCVGVPLSGDAQVPTMNEVREYLAIANRLYTAILVRLPHACHP
jgi:hypothetical protein